MEEPNSQQKLWACHQCAISRIKWPICKKWSVCHSCSKLGHVAAHCSAQWKRVSTQGKSGYGKERTNANGASCSKIPPGLAQIDSLPSQRLNGSFPWPSTELALNSVSQIPTAPSLHPPSLEARSASKAYQRADPRPFASHGFQAMDINHRHLMARAVVRHQVPTHEDFTIVSINPLLGHALQLDPIREVILEFLEEHMRFEVRDIQPTHLGQALVYFVHVHDRDILVNHSPYPYDDVQISFARHNQGRN
jgi:hypothetical protein